jgi:hypothetical protein
MNDTELKLKELNRISWKFILWLLVIGFIAFYWSDVGKEDYLTNEYNNQIIKRYDCEFNVLYCNLTAFQDIGNKNLSEIEELIDYNMIHKDTWYDTQKEIFTVIFYIILAWGVMHGIYTIGFSIKNHRDIPPLSISDYFQGIYSDIKTQIESYKISMINKRNKLKGDEEKSDSNRRT